MAFLFCQLALSRMAGCHAPHRAGPHTTRASSCCHEYPGFEAGLEIRCRCQLSTGSLQALPVPSPRCRALGYSSRMRAEAVAFLRTLTPEQRRLAAFAIDNPERLDWHYIPRERAGLPLKAMDDRQRAAAHALLRAVLSDVGYRKATDIMGLETVLRAIETRRFDRDPFNYAWTGFGDLDDGATRGFRGEERQLSINLK